MPQELEAHPDAPTARRFAIRRPEVVSEVFDGEAVVVDLTAGRYYAFDPEATAIWLRLADSPTFAELVVACVDRYGGAERARAGVAPILARRDPPRRRVAAADGAPAPAVAAVPPSDLSRPDFEVFDDLQDLLVLDPIHDLDESGWPTAPSASDDAGR
ncbi:MAG: PqqD family protein [Thermoanaerobaculia bacterium]